MIRFEGFFKVRDANALAFFPTRRHAPHPDGWRIAGEADADSLPTRDAAPSLSASASASPEQAAHNAKLHSINERNRAFWDAQPSTAGLRTAIDINQDNRQFYEEAHQ